MFDHISKHLKVCHIFNSLLGVWKCGQTQSFMLDIFNLNKELNKLITVKNPLLFQFNVRELCGFAIWTVYFWEIVLGVSITANRLAMRVILLAWFDSGSKGKCYEEVQFKTEFCPPVKTS